MNRRMMLRSCIAGAATFGSLIGCSESPLEPVGDGVADDSGALQALLDAARPGSTVRIPSPRHFYRIRHALLLQVDDVTVIGENVELRQTGIFQPAFLVVANGVTVTGFNLVGLRADRREETEAAIRCIGSPFAYLRNIRLSQNEISNWSHGIRPQYCAGLQIDKNALHDLFYAGILLESCEDGEIQGNVVQRIHGAPTAYGIAVSRFFGTLEQHPTPKRIRIHDNVVNDVPHWEAFDAHSGEDIEFFDNEASRVRLGIQMTFTDNFPPKRCRAYRNRIRSSGITPQTSAEIVGVPGAPAEDCSIEQNYFERFGTQGSVHGASVRVQNADRVVISRNVIVDSLQSAIAVFGTTRELRIDANEIVGLDYSAGSFIGGITIPSGTVTGSIRNNRITVGAAPGIRAYVPQAVVVANNLIETSGPAYYPTIDYFEAES